MRCMLSICEAYAADFCVSFNAAIYIYKCVVCVSRHKPKDLNFVRDAKFSINGNDIESVQSWSHLLSDPIGIPPLRTSQDLLESDTDKANALNDYFSSVFTKENNKLFNLPCQYIYL